MNNATVGAITDMAGNTVKCVKCGNPITTTTNAEAVSPIIKKQLDLKLCDKCFKDWFISNEEANK